MVTEQAVEALAVSPTEEHKTLIPRGPELVNELPDEIVAGLPDGSGMAVVLGDGARVSVRNGHLHITDRLGWHRRERSWSPAGGGLRRVVVGAESGTVTLDAITWCQTLGVALIVLDDAGKVVLAPGPHAPDEPRMRRAQATASEKLAISIAAGLIRPKLRRQAAVAGKSLQRDDVAASLRDFADALEDPSSIEEVRRLEAIAATCYFGAWVEHPAVVPRFSGADAKRVPPHWGHYDRRRTVVAPGDSNRIAERPTNTILNYLYRLAAVEARPACVAAGLAPEFGVLHNDASAKDSLVLDVLEPVRPEVDRYVLNLMATETFSRRDFMEQGDGSVRLGPALRERLTSTMPMWARAVAPFADQVAHAFEQVLAGSRLLRNSPQVRHRPTG
jgi:CRISPR-associated endonuclease Cas1